MQKIDRYEIIRELGAGGMATVFLARDPRIDREVANKFAKLSKFLSPQQADGVLRNFAPSGRALLKHGTRVASHGVFSMNKPSKKVRRSLKMQMPVGTILRIVQNYGIIGFTCT